MPVPSGHELTARERWGGGGNRGAAWLESGGGCGAGGLGRYFSFHQGSNVRSCISHPNKDMD